MLALPEDVHDAVVRHCRAEHPIEACGLIVADRDGHLRVLPMRNAAQSPTYFRFDPVEQLRVWQRLDDDDEEPIAIYHSHTDSAAYPSHEDIAFAVDPRLHYVIVGTRGPATEVRSFRIVEARVVEEVLHVAAIA